MANVRAAAQSLADFYNGAEVYKSFETAAGFGLTADTFAADVMKGFSENGSSSGGSVVEEVEGEETEETIITTESAPESGERAPLEQQDKTPQTEDPTDVYVGIKAQKDAIQQQIDNLEDDARKGELQSQLTAIEKQEKEFEEKYKQQLDREVEEILQRTEQNFKEQVEDIIKREQAKLDAGKLPDGIRAQLETYRSRINEINSSAQE